jgi:three-Cys-motif partner protein
LPGRTLKFDEVGYWSELKLDIVKSYATAYSTILAAQTDPKLHHIYIDAFAGPGVVFSKSKGEFIPGSPTNALLVKPEFKDYYLIDAEKRRTEALADIVGDLPNVHIREGDCNSILIEQVFPRVRYEDYRRGLCLLDPYGLHLDWKVIKTAAQMRSIEIFLNFPVADMNRNVLWHNPAGVDPADIQRMNRFWGDDSWKNIAYTSAQILFGELEKEDNETVAEGFRERLRKVAGFKRVPKPLPMRNNQGAVVYYLFFASQKATAEHIIDDIFAKYRNRRIAHGRQISD